MDECTQLIVRTDADEHRRFLLGLDELGKGSWRGISREFVITRISTQVASHAEKFFLRQGGGRSRRRASIHDITHHARS